MATRGRKPGFTMSDEHRSKISFTQIINRLNRVALGKEKMDSVEAQVALGLIRKGLPDLASQELQVTEQAPFALIPNEISDVDTWQDTFKPKVEH